MPPIPNLKPDSPLIEKEAAPNEWEPLTHFQRLSLEYQMIIAQGIAKLIFKPTIMHKDYLNAANEWQKIHSAIFQDFQNAIGKSAELPTV